jgi:DNA-directed RNA polymerase subunit K/omega
MERSEEGRVEELSRKVGGRFRLTTLIQKQARQYYAGGRTFMPTVRNFDDLFNYILDEIEEGKIDLLMPGEEEPPAEIEEAAEAEE